MHRPKAKACLLKWATLALLILSATAATQHSPTQKQPSILQRFFSGFTNDEETTVDNLPRWSTRNLRGDEPNVLFSYNFPSEVAERYRGNRRGLQAADVEAEVEEVKKRGPDPPVPVHVGGEIVLLCRSAHALIFN